MDRFQDFLNRLSPLLDVPLYIEKKRAVRIKINEAIHVQLEEDESKERILIACFVHEIPAGKYRENLLKEGLKTNALSPRIGTFAYSERNNQLTLFTHLYYVGMPIEKVADILALFIEKALLWRGAIERGVLPQISDTEIRVDHRVFHE